MKDHILTVISNRTPGVAPMIIGSVDEDFIARYVGGAPRTSGAVEEVELLESTDGELFRLEMKGGKRILTKFTKRPPRRTVGGSGKPETRECFRCGRVGHIAANCSETKHKNGGPPRAQRPKRVQNLEEEEEEIDAGLMEIEEVELNALDRRSVV